MESIGHPVLSAFGIMRLPFTPGSSMAMPLAVGITRLNSPSQRLLSVAVVVSVSGVSFLQENTEKAITPEKSNTGRKIRFIGCVLCSVYKTQKCAERFTVKSKYIKSREMT